MKDHLLAAAVVLFTAAAGCSEKAGAAGPSAGARPATTVSAPDGIRVRLAHAQTVSYRGQIVANGDLKPLEMAQLGFAVPGTLMKVAVKRGQMVRKGEVLGELDDALARAQLGQAEAGVAAAKAQAALAKDALDRIEKVRASDGASELQLVQARAGLQQAEAGVLSAEAAKSQAETNVRWQVLRAPFGGIVTRVPDGTGITVGPGVPLFALEATATLVLSTSVTAKEARALKVGGRVQVVSPTGGGSTEKATVRSIIESIDPMTKRVPIEIAVPNSDGAFLANAFARARAESDVERPAVSIPASSLIQREGNYAVFTVVGGVAKRIDVELLSQESGQAIVDGLTPDAVVVDFPPSDIAEGVKVEGVGKS